MTVVNCDLDNGELILMRLSLGPFRERPARSKHIRGIGGSYGGHMTWATATLLQRQDSVRVPIVGISGIVTNLENTEAYRRGLRLVEYGAVRDPALRACLDTVADEPPRHRAQAETTHKTHPWVGHVLHSGPLECGPTPATNHVYHPEQ